MHHSVKLGTAIGIRVAGRTADARNGQTLNVKLCLAVSLPAGHYLELYRQPVLIPCKAAER